MSIYGGFDPGTFQPWALNLLQSALGTAGIARGMAVTPATPASMNVVVNLDPMAQDGVCFLANGGWLRIDAAVTLSVPANISGASRVDAVVAELDPTGVGGAPQLVYITGWTTGYKGSGYGTPSSPNNQLVLALVTVPNGASSIVASNIAMTPLRASVGGDGPTARQTVVADPSGTTSHMGVFSVFNVVLAASAGSGQTTFAVPLAPRQRLVPMGKIGGQNEVGFFAGQNGWYVPRVVGSVSGTLPISNVDYAGGNLVLSIGAQSGEQITAAFKYYDFALDMAEWSSNHFLERDSPYIVYQGDAIPGTSHLTADLWGGVRNGVIITSGDVIIITFQGGAIQPRFRSHSSAAVPNITFSIANNGASQGTYTVNSQTDLPYYCSGPTNWLVGDQVIEQYALTCTAGQTEFGGAHTTMWPSPPTYYFDGGEGVVGGFPVYAGSTSVNLSAWMNASGATGLIYLDRFGNVTASMAVKALGEMYNGRIPIIQALQYGGKTNTSAWYGTYALPNQPNSIRPAIIAGTWNEFATVGANAPHGWQLQPDPTSPYGGYLTSNSVNDIITVVAAGSGIDLTLVGTATTTVNVNIVGFTQYATPVFVSAGNRVHLTLCSNLPPQTLFAEMQVLANNSGLSVEEAAIRIPAVPPVPNNAMPLSYVFVAGANTMRSNSWWHNSLAVGEMASGQTAQIVDPIRKAPGAGVWMANLTIGASIQANVASYTAARLVFLGTPSTGIATVRLGSQTATFDTYTPSAQVVYTAWFSGCSELVTYEVFSTGTKNTSSTGYDLYPSAIEVIEYPLITLDARQQPVDGIHPSIQGTALLGSRGEVVGDAAAYGIATAHVQDRAVTSRKVAPTWTYLQVTTPYSSSPTGTWVEDTALRQTITVEVPSVLWVQGVCNVDISSGGSMGMMVTVDGNLIGMQSSVNANTTNYETTTLYNQSWVPVTPGQHTISLYQNNGGGCFYPNNGFGRNVSAIAFAL